MPEFKEKYLGPQIGVTPVIAHTAVVCIGPILSMTLFFFFKEDNSFDNNNNCQPTNEIDTQLSSSAIVSFLFSKKILSPVNAFINGGTKFHFI